MDKRRSSTQYAFGDGPLARKFGYIGRKCVTRVQVRTATEVQVSMDSGWGLLSVAGTGSRHGHTLLTSRGCCCWGGDDGSSASDDAVEACLAHATGNVATANLPPAVTHRSVHRAHSIDGVVLFMDPRDLTDQQLVVKAARRRRPGLGGARAAAGDEPTLRATQRGADAHDLSVNTLMCRCVNDLMCWSVSGES